MVWLYSFAVGTSCFHCCVAFGRIVVVGGESVLGVVCFCYTYVDSEGCVVMLCALALMAAQSVG